MLNKQILSLIGAGSIAFMVAGGTLSWAAEALEPTPDRLAVEKIIREYLLANPEVIEEAKAVLEKRQEVAQEAAKAAALSQNADILMRSPTDFVVGNPDGDTTLVEFFDFNCGYCKRALDDIRQLASSDKGLRIVLKDFPILGPGSMEAAKVALAAKGQLDPAKQFDFHVKLLETEGAINGERALDVAQEMGLDVTRIKLDMEGETVKAAIAANMQVGQALGLTGTPSFIVGKEVVQGAVGFEPLKVSIDNARRCKGELTC